MSTSGEEVVKSGPRGRVYLEEICLLVLVLPQASTEISIPMLLNSDRVYVGVRATVFPLAEFSKSLLRNI
jgi:hypothetical protein